MFRTYDDWKSTDSRDAEEEEEQWDDDPDEGSIVICSLCKEPASGWTAHLHQGEWIGDECCWVEQLRSSE